MNVKTKISVLTVVSSCLFFLTSFVNSNLQNPPPTDVRCDKTTLPELGFSKIKKLTEVECNVCELLYIAPVYNSNGLLTGTRYEYYLGSEPAIWVQKECVDSSNSSDKCEANIVTQLAGGCTNIFIPCTKDDDPECVND